MWVWYYVWIILSTGPASERRRYIVTSSLNGLAHGPLTKYVKLQVVHAPGMPGTLSPPPPVSDPDMDHATCMTFRDACQGRKLAVSFEVGAGENVPSIPGACTPHNFTYLVRGPYPEWSLLRMPWTSKIHTCMRLNKPLGRYENM